MRNQMLTRAAGVVCAAALLTSCASAVKEPEAQTPSAALELTPDQLRRIQVEPLALTSFHHSVESTGTVAFDSDRATAVLAPISGPVSRLLVSVGAQVKAGEPLAMIASPDFAGFVSAYRKAEAAARNARRIADRDKELFENDALAKRELEQAETDAVGAQADSEAALQQLRALGVGEATLDEIRQGRPVTASGGSIRSPLDGTVVERLITPGQLLQAGTTPCFTVADLGSVWVMANIFESSLAFVAIGDPAEIRTDASPEAIPGVVDYIAAMVDPNTRAIGVRIAARNPKRLLKRDLYVRVAIHSKRDSTGLLVPVSAVLRDDEKLPFVYVQGAAGGFARRRLTLGPEVAERFVVLDGLKAGERVVAEGALFMQFAESQ